MIKNKVLVNIKPTKEEAAYLADLLKKIKVDIKSSRDLGIRVSKDDEKIVNSLSTKFSAAL